MQRLIVLVSDRTTKRGALVPLPSDPKVESKRMQELEIKARANSHSISQDYPRRHPGPSPPNPS
jgi:hypothetical protein